MTDVELIGSLRPHRSARARETLGVRHGALAQPWMPMATAVAVAILVLVTIRFGRSPDDLAVLWLPNAVAVAMWLRCGKGRAYDISFGALIAIGIVTGQLLAGYGDVPALVMGACHLIEIIAAVALARRFAPDLRLGSIKAIARFVTATAIFAPVPAAVLGALSLLWLRDLPVVTGFQTWWLAHAVGMMILTPLLLSLNRGSLSAIRDPLRALEWGALFGVLAVLVYVIYWGGGSAFRFLLNPWLVLIAFRLRMAGVMAALLAAAVSALASTLHLAPPAYRAMMTLDERVMLSQFTILFGAFFFILVSTFLDERDELSARAAAGQRRAELASEAKSRLLANVAHEIKSPVGGIIGMGEMWASGQLGPVTAMQKEMAEMLVKTARQIEALAHDLLDVARAESGAVKVDLRPTDVKGVLEDICRAMLLLPEAAGRRIDVVCDSEGLVAIADSQRLSQVITNLATNALKYGDAGGIVTLSARRAAGIIRIEVIDNGPGLSPEKQAQLFEPFNRLGLERSAIEGHGIGLALAKRLTELQGGSIGVHSAVGEGATFWIEVPAA